jgi:hypothetical protein
MQPAPPLYPPPPSSYQPIQTPPYQRNSRGLMYPHAAGHPPPQGHRGLQNEHQVTHEQQGQAKREQEEMWEQSKPSADAMWGQLGASSTSSPLPASTSRPPVLPPLQVNAKGDNGGSILSGSRWISLYGSDSSTWSPVGSSSTTADEIKTPSSSSPFSSYTSPPTPLQPLGAFDPPSPHLAPPLVYPNERVSTCACAPTLYLCC